MSNPLQYLSGLKDLDAETFTRLQEIANVVGNQSICLAVNGGLKNHLVGRIAGLRAPKKLYVNRFD